MCDWPVSPSKGEFLILKITFCSLIRIFKSCLFVLPSLSPTPHIVKRPRWAPLTGKGTELKPWITDLPLALDSR